jgi:hypothetical protein
MLESAFIARLCNSCSIYFRCLVIRDTHRVLLGNPKLRTVKRLLGSNRDHCLSSGLVITQPAQVIKKKRCRLLSGCPVLVSVFRCCGRDHFNGPGMLRMTVASSKARKKSFVSPNREHTPEDLRSEGHGSNVGFVPKASNGGFSFHQEPYVSGAPRRREISGNLAPPPIPRIYRGPGAQVSAIFNSSAIIAIFLNMRLCHCRDVENGDPGPI